MPILHWLNKEQAVTTAKKCAYRLLEEVPDLSYGASNNENMLIQGDNLEALKALIPFYAGKVKCVFIDPPYNTKSAFEHYDDNLEHSKWLSLIYPRLELLRELLSEDGSIWVAIDDNEAHYLKVIMDEVFGRNNFVNTISVNMKNIAGASGGGEDKKLKKNIEYVHLYSKNYETIRSFKGVYDYIRMSSVVEQYRQDGKSWKYTTVLFYEGDKEYVGSTVDGDGNEIKIYLRINPIYKSINQIVKDEKLTESEAYDKYSEKIFEAKDAQSSIRTRIIEARTNLSIEEDLLSIEYVPKTGRNKGLLYEQFYKGEKCRLFAWLRDVGETVDGVLCKKNRLGTYWDETSSINNLTKEGDVQFSNGKKPESLLNKIMHMCTNEGDLVLDSFLGSGTTAAVAHKMNRRYIGIEIGDHAQTHCQPRLTKVVDGESGGISKAIDWQGGGGFKFVRLGQAVFDEYGSLNSDIKFPTLAAHVWYLETKQPMAKKKRSAYLGVHGENAYYLLYNGILGDRRPDGGNVLTSKVLKALPSFEEHLKHNRNIVIYGESTRLGEARLRQENIVFKQIPYDVGAL